MVGGKTPSEQFKEHPDEDPDYLQRIPIDTTTRVSSVTVWQDRGKISSLSLKYQNNESVDLRCDSKRLCKSAVPHQVKIEEPLQIIGFYGRNEKDLITQLGLLLWNPNANALI